MTLPTKKPGQFNWQTIFIGAGASVVVFLTILAAFFLARNDLTSATPPPATSTPDTLNPGIITPLPDLTSPTSTPPSQPGFTPIVVTPDLTTPTPSPTQGSAATFTPPPTLSPVPATPTPTFTLIPTSTSTPRPTSTPCVPRTDWVIYIVQRGDTLFSLATKTNISVDTLRLANCLPNTTIIEGQQLRLPFLPPTPTSTWTPTMTSSPTVTNTPTETPTATVQPGETPTETPTHTATPPDVSLGTPTPTQSPTLPVVLPTETETPTSTPPAGG